MSIQTTKGGSRQYTVTTADNSSLLEIGPAGTTQSVAVFVVQFNPSLTWAGSFVVKGRTLGTAADALNMPFDALPYRRVSLAHNASDYAIVSDPITGAAIIQIPANGLSIALQVVCTAGSCNLTSWDLQGSSAI